MLLPGFKKNIITFMHSMRKEIKKKGKEEDILQCLIIARSKELLNKRCVTVFCCCKFMSLLEIMTFKLSSPEAYIFFLNGGYKAPFGMALEWMNRKKFSSAAVISLRNIGNVHLWHFNHITKSHGLSKLLSHKFSAGQEAAAVLVGRKKKKEI